jgi:transcriptional regulator with XRE-family HTH domain
MSGWDGFGQRLREAMVEKGVVNRKGDPDVTRFAISHGWIPNYVYRWLADETTPERPNLDKLAEALGVTPWWLLFGDQPGVSKAPVPPRKRGAKKLGCLVAALLGIATAGGMSAPPLAPETASGSALYSHNTLGRGIMSRWRRKITTRGSWARPHLRQVFSVLTAAAA